MPRVQAANDGTAPNNGWHSPNSLEVCAMQSIALANVWERIGARTKKGVVSTYCYGLARRGGSGTKKKTR